ncbi:Rv3235 family protein [Nocardia sp. CNY236]|uniref:Rv3235 family protein n=1 Tax=Nocardia sp. CNY236 TaxID=1169152 RepID=UPI00040DB86F|nr:Rv3235 family protein [Nocardia sp. CNY236]
MAGYRDWLAPAPNPEPPLDSRRTEGGNTTRDPATARAQPCRSRVPAVPARVKPGAPGALHRGRRLDVGDEQTRAAARRFAESAVRVVLEALDRRRPVSQLKVVADATVVSAVRTLIGGDLVPGRRKGVAVPVRVGVVLVDTRTAEVYAGYTRGGRHFALAARIARTRTTGWRLTALRVR